MQPDPDLGSAHKLLKRQHIIETAMGITLDIPESVVRGMQVPPAEAEQRLRTELAAALDQQQVLALGPAAELAKMSREMFGALLGHRGIERHYSEDDLARDLAYARSQ